MPVRPPDLNQHLLVVRLESRLLYLCHSSRSIPAVLAALGVVSPGLFQTARVCFSIMNFPVTMLDCYLALLFRRYPLESRTRQLCKAECDYAPCARLVRPCVPTFFSTARLTQTNVSSIFEHLARAHTPQVCLIYQCSSWVSSCGLCHDRQRLNGGNTFASPSAQAQGWSRDH